MRWVGHVEILRRGETQNLGKPKVKRPSGRPKMEDKSFRILAILEL